MGRAPTEPPANPNDLTAISGGPPTSEQQGSRGHKRKQTLLSLLDALAELSKDDELDGIAGAIQQPPFEDDRDVPTVDEHLQKVGAEAFNKFQRRVMNLDKELRNFANAARQLGSSVGILSSSYHLRGRLAQILYLFRENAADLFPRKVRHQTREESVTNPTLHYLKTKRHHRAPPHVHNPIVDDKLDPEDIPEQLRLFARDVTTFLDCLNEFPEFTDESVNSAILSLDGDLKYWASCLKAYEGQFRYPAVQRYLHDLSGEMGDHIDNITSSLSIFIDIGVPTIRFAQKHASQNLLNLSTVATFFSAVTATTLQFSFDTHDTSLANAVNSFWFTSLVFSIGAAVNSLLGLTWKQAMYRSPGHRVPWWVLIWIKRSPLAFLVLSVACFSIGLILFAYSSGQHSVTCTLTTVFSACSILGLTAVSAWFISERWTFSRHNGTKWLADVLSETRVRVKSTRGFKWLVYLPRAWMWIASRWVKVQFRRFSEGVSELSSRAVSHLHSDSEEKLPDPEANSPIPTCASPEPLSPARRTASDVGMLLPIAEVRSPTVTSFDGGEGDTVASVTTETLATAAPPRGRFANAVRAVIKMRVASTAFPVEGRNPRRQRTMSSDGGSRGTEPAGVLKNSRVGTLMPKLRSLHPTQSFEAHSALVRHLQFSPNGKFLATSSWDRTSVIFKVGETFTSHRILAHPQGFVGQVAWSPSGNLLLTKLGRGVKLWTEDGVCRRTIDRRRNVQSIAWLPGGDGFLSVEGSDVTKLNLDGVVLAQYHLERMILHDVAATHDNVRMVCVGTLTASSDGLHPSKCRAEKQIIVYNMVKEEIENRVPVLHEVRDITLARNDQMALVSYENKAPPQLWKLDPVKDTVRLSLRHTYMPKMTVDFAGPSYFGGKNDQLVLCAGKAGDIHIWDRESATLLHHIRSQTVGGDLTCIAWNHAWDTFMFATGSHDGGVRIWTSPAANTGSPEASLAPSRLLTPSNTPRTMTPSPYDADFRSDSPTGQLAETQDDPSAHAGPSTAIESQPQPQPGRSNVVDS